MVIVLATVVLAAFGIAILLQIVGLRAGSALRHRAYVLLRNGLYANAMLDRLVGAYRA
jgi:hypothetical protein